jgi:hypothetical protein
MLRSGQKRDVREVPPVCSYAKQQCAPNNWHGWQSHLGASAGCCRRWLLHSAFFWLQAQKPVHTANIKDLPRSSCSWGAGPAHKEIYLSAAQPATAAALLGSPQLGHAGSMKGSSHSRPTTPDPCIAAMCSCHAPATACCSKAACLKRHAHVGAVPPCCRAVHLPDRAACTGASTCTCSCPWLQLLLSTLLLAQLALPLHHTLLLPA